MDQPKNRAPEVTLGQYKGLAVTRHLRAVSESAVEHEVRRKVRAHGTYELSSEPAQRGCRVLLDFEGFMDGEPVPDSKMTDVRVCLGDGKLMPAAEQAVYGHCAGETFRFDFTYPQEFRVPELSGKTAQFEITLHTVEQLHLPTADDAFAKRMGYASLEALKESIREAKRRAHAANADRKAGAELLDQAGANLTVRLPEDVLERTAENELGQLKARLQKSGIPFEEYCKNSHTTPEQVAENYRRDAERKVRGMLAARAIAKAEQITVNKDEVNQEYMRLAQLHGNPVAEIRKVLPEDAVSASLAARKVQRFLLDNAQVTDVVDGTGKE